MSSGRTVNGERLRGAGGAKNLVVRYAELQ